MCEADMLEDKKTNSINTIRMLAAVQVMYGHILGHLDIKMPWLITQALGRVFYGVPIFFTLSGFLIWFSIERSGNYCEYLKKRFLRIYPELWIAVGAEIFAIVLLYRNYTIKDLLLFTVTQSTVLQFWTPDSLRGYGIGTPNGALWTISVLVQFYILAWFLYKCLKGKNIRVWVAAFGIFVFISCYVQILLEKTAPEIIVKLYGQTILRYLWMFLAGMFTACYFERLMGLLMKFWAVFLIISAVLGLLGIDLRAGYGLFRTICLFCGVIGFAYRFPGANLKKDITYGMYIYHCTVINVMFSFGMIRSMAYGILCYAISIVLGLISTYVAAKIVVFIEEKERVGI